VQKSFGSGKKKNTKNVNLINFNYISAISAGFYHGKAKIWR
jgi:hypothetical protein